MLPRGEPVRENGRADEEEEEMEIDGQNGNQECDETEEEEQRQEESQDGGNDEIQEEKPSGFVVKIEEYDDEEEGEMEIDGQNGNQECGETEEEEQRQKESQDGENDEIQEEKPSGYVLVKVEEYDEEEEDEEQRRRRRTAEKGKQLMPDHGGITITELKGEDDNDYHLDLAILRTILDYKCNTWNSPQSSFNNELIFIKDSFPDLQISIEDLGEKIKALWKRFIDVRQQHGDDPQLAQPIDREIFNLSMRLWGRRY